MRKGVFGKTSLSFQSTSPKSFPAITDFLIGCLFAFIKQNLSPSSTMRIYKDIITGNYKTITFLHSLHLIISFNFCRQSAKLSPLNFYVLWVNFFCRPSKMYMCKSVKHIINLYEQKIVLC